MGNGNNAGKAPQKKKSAEQSRADVARLRMKRRIAQKHPELAQHFGHVVVVTTSDRDRKAGR